MYLTKLEGQSFLAYRQMVQELKTRAMNELKTNEDGIVVRELRPDDVGLATSNWTFNLATSAAFNNNLVNLQIANNRWIGIYGVLIGQTTSQAGAQVRVKSAGLTKRFWQIQNIQVVQDNSMYFFDPVITDQNQTLTIDIYASAVDATEQIQFIGVVVEKKGILVQ